MNLILDDREETGLFKLLSGYELEVTQARLDYGDACWEGHGPKGPVLIGVERKRLNDLVSSMQDRRLSGHQLKGMWSQYDYCYLIVEDMWRPDDFGGVEVHRGGAWRPLYSARGEATGSTFQQLINYLNTLEVLGNVIVLRSFNTRETAAMLAALVKWWAKEWDEHHSHDEVYAPEQVQAMHRGKALVSFREPGMVEKIAAQLPGIDRLCWEVGRKFKTVEEMVNAEKKDWMEVPGIGEGRAVAAILALHGRRWEE